MPYLDLPGIKGALYIEHCEKDYRCFYPVGENYIAEEAKKHKVRELVISARLHEY